MALSDILRPKSKEETADLIQRGFVAQAGGKWKFRLQVAQLLEEYEENEDTANFKVGLIEILNDAYDNVEKYISFSNDESSTEDTMIEYENIVEEFEMLDEVPEEDEIDYVLNMLYDFCDEHNIWVESMETMDPVSKWEAPK